jgi:hypothetical protein
VVHRLALEPIAGERRAMSMAQIEFALAHPVFDPVKQIVVGHWWWVDRGRVSACLTANIGIE